MIIARDEKFRGFPITLPMTPNYRFDLPFHEARAEWKKLARTEQIKYELMARAHYRVTK